VAHLVPFEVGSRLLADDIHSNREPTSGGRGPPVQYRDWSAASIWTTGNWKSAWGLPAQRMTS